ncbi:MAG: hypothetical protein Q4D87_02850 [Actinomycetaceae bacterium]|nr:hypothetical protein [Actinomycetaceae bacterium]
MRHLSTDEERLLVAVRQRLLKAKKTHVNDAVIDEVTRLVSALTAPRPSVVDQVGPVCSTADLVDLMGVSRQAINKAVKEFRILGVRRGRGSWMYPTWQLTSDYQILDGLPDVLGRLECIDDSFAVGKWFITAHRDLQGMSPAAWLREERDVSQAVRVAENLARHHRTRTDA